MTEPRTQNPEPSEAPAELKLADMIAAEIEKKPEEERAAAVDRSEEDFPTRYVRELLEIQTSTADR